MTTTDLRDVHDQAAKALAAVEGDGGASPVLAAVTREFVRKADKAIDLADGNREWEAVIEVEQAGDSAKAAAEADQGASEETRAAVDAAHLSICMLKAGVAQSPSARSTL